MSTPLVSSTTQYIALFGFYEYGNFGDDLMAVIFGQELKSLHITFRVYHLKPEIAVEFAFDVAETIDELLVDAVAVVYGGGGAFLASNLTYFEATLQDLHEKCSVAGIPVYMFSVGGDGKPFEEIGFPRRLLMSRASFITFRNKEDESLLNRIGHKNGAVFHDVVWQTPKFFPAERSELTGFTIGIDNSLMHKRRHRWIVRLLMAFCRILGKQYRFVNFVQSQKEKVFDGFAESICYADNMHEFIRSIQRTNVIITHRLHLGIVAMSYDIPVIEMFPQRKATLLFKRLGLNRFMFSRLSLLRLFWLITKERTLRALRPSKLINDYENVVEDSANHLRQIARIVKQCDSNRGG